MFVVTVFLFGGSSHYRYYPGARSLVLRENQFQPNFLALLRVTGG